ncbi:hypothetical protein J4Q44_G00013280 [Coregonus suidteri]|uniref:HEAT repeat-containing protein 1 n=1 Tax=Coregonus suidteri TaxID=861788 RepID=A0AAN8MRJ7_9TELE
MFPGCTGLEELLGIEPAFSEFQETLFSQASAGLEHGVQSKEVNEKLDAGISLFLTRLSPYFLLKPAQKCREWLVHRCLETSTVEQGDLEYTKRLILSGLLNVCQKLSPDRGPVSKDVLDEFNVELVVQCVRVSDMPQTHHHALLLLASSL